MRGRSSIVAFAASIVGLSSSAWAQFDPNAWTLVGEPHGSGSLTPDEMIVVSSDVMPCTGTPKGLTAFVSVAAHDGVIHAHLRYVTTDFGGAQWDWPVYLVNGVPHAVNDFMSKYELDFAFPVQAGDAIGFGMFSADCGGGSATVTFSHFGFDLAPAAPLVAPRLFAQNGLIAQTGLGAALAPLGDLDGDGIAEIAVGSALDDPNVAPAGAVHVRATRTNSTWFSLAGPAPGSAFGRAVVAIGDVDGDGTTDLAIGAPRHSAAATASGSIRLVSGASGSTLWTTAGPVANARLGSSLAALGDIDGDGIPDLASTAPGVAQVFVLSGLTGTTLSVSIEPAIEPFPRVASAGDVDSDGVPDVAIGRPYATGPLGAFQGTVTMRDATTSVVLASFLGAQASLTGAALGGPVDTDADGAVELLIGAPTAKYFGTPVGHIVSLTPSTGRTSSAIFGDVTEFEFGRAVDFVGDVNADGVEDIAIGGRGYVRVHSGSQDGALLSTLTDSASGDAFGGSVAPARDFNGDGRADVVIGAPTAAILGKANAGRFVIATATCGSLDSIGSSCTASTGHASTLTANGCAAIGTTIELRVDGAPPAAQFMLFASTNAATTPLGNGCIALIDLANATTLVASKVNALGTWTLQAKLPPSINGPIFAQAFVVDTGSPSGFTTTNAVQATLP